MATAPRINVFHGLSGNVENARRNEPNIKNSAWRNKWYPNKSINEMKAIQQTRQGDPEAYGAHIFIKLNPSARAELINKLKTNSFATQHELIITLNRIMAQAGRSKQETQYVLYYLRKNKAAILSDPRLQGGRSRKAKKLRNRNRKTRR